MFMKVEYHGEFPHLLLVKNIRPYEYENETGHKVSDNFRLSIQLPSCKKGRALNIMVSTLVKLDINVTSAAIKETTKHTYEIHVTYDPIDIMEIESLFSKSMDLDIYYL